MKLPALIAFSLATLTLPATAAPLGKVLVVLPAATTLSTREGKAHPTGYYLSELALPLRALKAVGVEPVIATPQGKVPKMDARSDGAKHFASPAEYQAVKKFVAGLAGLKKPRSLEALKTADLLQIDGILIPGGHAAMEDLPKNKALGEILNYFYAQKRPTAAICHGPVALLAARTTEGSWLYAGYRATVFSTAEEKNQEDAGNLDGHVLFYPQEEFTRQGAQVQVKGLWESNVVQDRELITAQNPQSATEFASVLVKAVVEQIWNARLAKQAYLVEPKPFQAARDNVTTIFVGLRKAGFKGSLTERLKSHTQLVRKSMGDSLLSYKVYANEDLEIALMTWKSAKAQEETFAKSGAPVVTDAAQFLETVVYAATDLR